ncbi:MAG: hypothetical protein FWD72_04740 [Eggerthellaceae bacterium]|nr:hypothetical protein [Eggerthellaceae bacterium]
METIPMEHAEQTPGGKHHKLWRRTLVFLSLFVGIGALGGGAVAILPPTTDIMGAEALVPILHEAPLFGQYIDSLVIPASALLLFVCLPQLLAALLLLRKRPSRYKACIICGAVLVAFTVGELILIPNFASVLYLLFGAVEIFAGYTCLRNIRK